MAAEWVSCGSGFIEADVIRWTEGVWQKPRRWRGHAVNVGDRVVIAEVIRDDGEWVDLLVRDCTVASEISRHQVAPLPKNTAVRRKRLAELAEIFPTHAGLLERGKRNASLNVGERVARALGVPLSDLILEVEKQWRPLGSLTTRRKTSRTG